jgi:hypothetical protein
VLFLFFRLWKRLEPYLLLLLDVVRKKGEYLIEVPRKRNQRAGKAADKKSVIDLTVHCSCQPVLTVQSPTLTPPEKEY